MRMHDEVDSLISLLYNKDGAVRAHARIFLVRVGKSAVPHLVALLKSKNDQIRWEACKTLGEIKDPSAAPALAEALNDDVMDVRWVAAEALIALGDEALKPLLKELEIKFDSIFLRESAEHVLHALEKKNGTTADVREVLEALNDIEPKIKVAWAAQKALDALRTVKTE